MKLVKLILVACAAAVIVGIGTLQYDKQLWKKNGKSDKPQIDFARELYGDPGPLGTARAQMGPDPLRDKVKELLNDDTAKSEPSKTSKSTSESWWNWANSKVFGKPK